MTENKKDKNVSINIEADENEKKANIHIESEDESVNVHIDGDDDKKNVNINITSDDAEDSSDDSDKEDTQVNLGPTGIHVKNTDGDDETEVKIGITGIKVTENGHKKVNINCLPIFVFILIIIGLIVFGGYSLIADIIN